MAPSRTAQDNTGQVVLITGATGHLGFRVLVLALEAGYKARLAVRNQSKADEVLAAPSIKALKAGSDLQFVVIPDILADGAYDEAVKDVKYIIHCASPITSGITENFEEKIIQPAIKGTTGILESAYKSPSVKRVAITSSLVAVVPFEAMAGGLDDVFDGRTKIEPKTSGYGAEWEAYVDSKVRALAATYDFVEQRKPQFDVVNLNPSFIVGKNELVTKTSDFMGGTNKVLLAQVLGIKVPNPLPGTTVYLNDIAKLHVLALDPRVPSNENYVANSGGLDGTHLSDAKDIVARKYQKEVAEGLLPNNGNIDTVKLRIDASRTEEAFGLKFAGLETQVTEITDHYLELLAKEKGNAAL